jgi:hypothetical protein
MRPLLARNRAQEPLRLAPGKSERRGDDGGAFGFARDAKTGAQPGRVCVLAQEGKAERMEGVNRDLIGAIGKECRQAVAHFGGSAAGKRNGKASLGSNPALGDEMGDAIGQSAGLPRSGTCDDQQRPVDRFGRRALVGIKVREETAASRRLTADQPQPRPRRRNALAIIG